MQYRLNPQYRLFLCLRLEQDTLHWFVCDLDGTPLENHQLNPDITVYNDPADELSGHDSQLEQAVRALMAK